MYYGTATTTLFCLVTVHDKIVFNARAFGARSTVFLRLRTKRQLLREFLLGNFKTSKI